MDEAKKLTKAEGTRLALRLFANYGKPYLRWFLLAMLCLLVASSFALAFPFFIGRLLDSAFKNRNAHELNQTLGFLVGVLGLQAVFSFGRAYLLNAIGERIVTDLRKDLYRHLIGQSVTFFANRRVGELTSRIASDATIIQGACTLSLAEALRHLMVSSGGIIVMFLTNTRLTLLMLGIVPFLVLSAAFFGRRIRGISTRIQDRLADATSVLDETFSGIRTVQSFAREEHEIGRYSQFVEAAQREALKRALARGLFNAFIVFVMFSGVVVLLWYSGHQVLEGRLSAGQLMAFMLYTMAVGTAVASFTELYGEFNQTLGASQRIVELFATRSEIADPPQAKSLVSIQGRVEFRNVVFSYAERPEIKVLDGVNILAQPGEVIALVGPSGAGKSTLISLIPRFYDIQAGTILVDGCDVREVKLTDLREHVGIVPQETLLFGGTIKDNIRYGRLAATQAEIEQAAQAANAHEFVTKFPHGYETVIGERGVKLSGGQRQRIAIARALLKNPKILILDEATSSLDSESEKLVQEALDTLMEGRTTFVIAHRLSTVRRANRILVLQDGTIVESGTHDELMELEGLYRKLYDLQFRDEAVLTELGTEG
ncbi:MAG: ATP-binding cassette domain-containing protein [Blastocatellia bacterium]|nr:ATP-binding cassette domain-containing protein [Blastocatellia bacterium]